MKGIFVFLLLLSASLALSSCSRTSDGTKLRLGYFPNITHSQAVIGIQSGAFQKTMGNKVNIVPMLFNAGPSVIEALFAGEIDIAYIGPNPAINGYIKSKGEALRIIAGATSGGAGLVIRQGSGIRSEKDFHRKKIASPQLGNTQDVALRDWLAVKGYKLKEKGGDVEVIPIPNPDQLTLFMKNEIDGAWTVEPWVSRLIIEGKGGLFLDERSLWPKGKFVTANIIVSSKFLKEHRDIVKNFLEEHVSLTLRINKDIPWAKKIVNSELKRLTGKELKKAVIDQAFSRLDVTYDPVSSSLKRSAGSAFRQGFLGKVQPDLSSIYDLSILNEVLKEKGLRPVK